MYICIYVHMYICIYVCVWGIFFLPGLPGGFPPPHPASSRRQGLPGERERKFCICINIYIYALYNTIETYETHTCAYCSDKTCA